MDQLAKRIRYIPIDQIDICDAEEIANLSIEEVAKILRQRDDIPGKVSPGAFRQYCRMRLKQQEIESIMESFVSEATPELLCSDTSTKVAPNKSSIPEISSSMIVDVFGSSNNAVYGKQKVSTHGNMFRCEYVPADEDQKIWDNLPSETKTRLVGMMDEILPKSSTLTIEYMICRLAKESKRIPGIWDTGSIYRWMYGYLLYHRNPEYLAFEKLLNPCNCKSCRLYVE